MRALNNKDIATSFQRFTRRIALESAYLLNEDELLIRCFTDDMQVGMVTMHYFTTGEAHITRILWSKLWIRVTSTKQRLSKAVRKQAFANMLGPREQISMTHLLREQCAAQ